MAGRWPLGFGSRGVRNGQDLSCSSHHCGLSGDCWDAAAVIVNNNDTDAPPCWLFSSWVHVYIK